MRRGWRLRTVLAAAATSVVAVAFLAALLVGLAGIGELADPAAEAAARRSLVVALGIGALSAIVLSTFLILAIGRRIGRSLELLREQVDAIRAGDDPQADATAAPIFEYRALAQAVERLDQERHERVQSLQRERDELAKLLNSVSEGILRVGPDGRLVHANPAARKLLGITDDATGQLLSAVIRHAELRKALEDASRGETVSATEVSIDDRRLIMTARPLAGSGGIVVAFVDFTEIRRLEGVRRDFVANVSHELKTPLTSIRGYVETLQTDDLPAEMRHQFLDVIQKNADRLQGIVDDLLDLSRLESGGWRPVPMTVDPVSFATEVWSTCARQAEKRGIRFETEGESVAVVADPGGLRQVLANLFDNALRHTPENGSVRVTVAASAAGCRTPEISGNGRQTTTSAEAPTEPDPGKAAAERCVLIQVSDTGSGIPKDALPRIFERFYRVDPARSRAEGGTGLGLSIVKHLIESMGGSVDAESELGKGTAIRIHLPAA